MSTRPDENQGIVRYRGFLVTRDGEADLPCCAALVKQSGNPVRSRLWQWLYHKFVLARDADQYDPVHWIE
ncbi:MAG: hypothetical protein ACLP6W_17265 [Bryobacteraceae bacterium]